jgi:hypothetical protein
MVKSMYVAVILVCLVGCAHHGAVRVKCDGVLRPVNAPIDAHEPPVSVSPTNRTEASMPEVQP